MRSSTKCRIEQAQEQVAQALAPLGETYVRALRTGFASRWIDVLENEGKRSGAYSWGIVRHTALRAAELPGEHG